VCGGLFSDFFVTLVFETSSIQGILALAQAIFGIREGQQGKIHRQTTRAIRSAKCEAIEVISS